MKTIPKLPLRVTTLKNGVKSPPQASRKQPAALATDRSIDCINFNILLLNDF